MLLKRLVFLLFLMSVSASLRAHETWLLAEDFRPPAGASAEFTMSSGMAFPAPGSGIDRRRIAEAALAQGGERRNLIPAGAREDVLVLSGVPEAGTACAWVRLNPRILEIPDATDVEHYLDEIGAPDAVWTAWRGDRGEELWRESYSKLARTYLKASGGDSAGSCIGEVSDARFEILPLGDPTELEIGDALELQVLFDGAPLAGQAVGFIREGEEHAALRRSDEAGRVSLPITGDGRHMIYATNLRPATGADFNWESDFTTLTFRVEDR